MRDPPGTCGRGDEGALVRNSVPDGPSLAPEEPQHEVTRRSADRARTGT